MGKSKNKHNQSAVKNTLEAVQGYGEDTLKSVAKGTVSEVNQIAEDFFSDLLGFGLGKSSESSHEQGGKGEVELFNAESHNKKSEKPHKLESRAHIEYHDDIRKVGEKASRVENHQMVQKVQEILAELQRLMASSKELQQEFAEYAVETTPKDVGEYHLNFFEWLLITVRQARERVESAGSWLSAIKGKNGKKGSFINDMWKKGNTSVTMSNERSSATSVG